MARTVLKTAKQPMLIQVGSETKAICMCGLSPNQPFCNGSHRMTQDEEEGKLYKYVDGQRVEVDKS